MKENADRKLSVLLMTMLGVAGFVLLVGLATNAKNMFPSSNVSWLESVATGLVTGAGTSAIFYAIRYREEVRQLRSDAKNRDPLTNDPAHS